SGAVRSRDPTVRGRRGSGRSTRSSAGRRRAGARSASRTPRPRPPRPYSPSTVRSGRPTRRTARPTPGRAHHARPTRRWSAEEPPAWGRPQETTRAGRARAPRQVRRAGTGGRYDRGTRRGHRPSSFTSTLPGHVSLRQAAQWSRVLPPDRAPRMIGLPMRRLWFLLVPVVSAVVLAAGPLQAARAADPGPKVTLSVTPTTIEFGDSVKL